MLRRGSGGTRVPQEPQQCWRKRPTGCCERPTARPGAILSTVSCLLSLQRPWRPLPPAPHFSRGLPLAQQAGVWLAFGPASPGQIQPTTVPGQPRASKLLNKTTTSPGGAWGTATDKGLRTQMQPPPTPKVACRSAGPRL